jgi:hypothetical protein
LAKDHAERRAARKVTEDLPDRYQRLVAQQDQTTYIHLTEARVVASGVSPLPAAGMHWRGRLSVVVSVHHATPTSHGMQSAYLGAGG